MTVDSKGDRVRVTGVFAFNTTFIPLRLAVEPPRGKVEKLPAGSVPKGKE